MATQNVFSGFEPVPGRMAREKAIQLSARSHRDFTRLMSTASAALAAFALLAYSPSLLSAQWVNAHEADESCKGFVQSFYDSYEPWFPNQLRRGSSMEPWTRHSDVFNVLDAELARQLREVFDAESKSGEILLDFDPILNSQHARDEYVAGKVSHKGDHCLVEVYGVSNGRENDQPDVVPELVFQVRRWTFVNFHYPNRTHPSSDENLLSMLKRIRKSIGKAPPTQPSAKPEDDSR